jgi:hypothetical protein
MIRLGLFLCWLFWQNGRLPVVDVDVDISAVFVQERFGMYMRLPHLHSTIHLPAAATSLKPASARPYYD